MNKKKLGKFWKNEKARAQLLSGVVVALMILTAVTGLFLMSDQAQAATIITHDFETLPGAGWSQMGSIDVVQDGTIKHSGSYSGVMFM